MTAFEIREEREPDIPQIYKVTEIAFRDMAFSDGDEADVVDRLRQAGALSLSLVAIVKNTVIGQVTLSPARSANSAEQWYALGPVSVLPEYQGAGIGSALIRRALDEISANGAAGCMLTGNPAYYQKFGFELAPQNAPANEPAEFFMVKVLGSQSPPGILYFHEAFYGDG